MSKLFSPVNIAKLSLKNRFVRSVVHMNSCDLNGFPTQELLKFYRDLADGEFGPIISGFLYPILVERSSLHQGSMATEKHAGAWKSTIDYCHNQGSEFVFQVGDTALATKYNVIHRLALELTK
ncbi:NADH-dependent flavin oxidoreductase, putative [Trichomonas vaginalis G3]|uniref:NADH-dependent flavin oxidoreductase, putative n=1 Tax=Trichomonas vaginalis (strain ATCC PRA-98 / G3) TaxID=412133 RepID=A2EDQ2_TRIV3|nr:NADH-dependent flavin oxidoreductase, putative [Trichomonas vaginalis G3]|eukprot:XP_001321440.1 NADH-dependent flavin oxidoreductase [Trichomonas vaginalis G3]